MEEVQYTGRKGLETHYIYTVAEAQGLGIPFLADWKQAEEAGQWVTTDDGKVVEVLSTGKMRTGTPWLRSCTGTFLASSNAAMDTARRPSRYTFTGKKVTDQPFRLTERQRQWIFLFCRGQHPIESYLKVFNGSSQRHAERRVFDLLKRPEVRQAVKAELKETLEKLKISDEFVLERYKNMADDIAVNDNVRFKCLTELADIIELKPKDQLAPGGFLGFGGVVDAVESGRELGSGVKTLTTAETELLGEAETLEEEGPPV